MRTNAVTVVALLALATGAGADDWPGFRGPGGQGVSAEKDVPVRWGPSGGVLWKTAIPGEGWSSPVVAGGRVFVTAATEGGESCRVLGLDAARGRVLWDVEALRQPRGHKLERNSYATPTPATDGERVYAAYNGGGVAAVTVDGKPAWVNTDVKHYSQHGYAASPVVYRDLVILAHDGSSEGPDKTVGWQKPWERSFLRALDRKTGREVWRAGRGPSRIAHVTPVVVSVGGQDVLVSPAGDVIQGFDPASGRRLWTVAVPGEGVVPSPVAGDGLVFAASGFGDPALRAVRLTGAGEGREVAWEAKKQVPMIPSPLYLEPHLYTVTEGGIAVCREAATGRVVWEERLGGGHAASPVAAAGHVYFLSERGEMTVVRAGPKFEVVARNRVGEECQASPAVAGGRLFVRGRTHLFCISQGQ